MSGISYVEDDLPASQAWPALAPKSKVKVLRKLQDARLKLHSMELKKSGRNTFAGYDYFELGDFVLPTLRIFSELNLCGVVSFDNEYARLTITDLDSGESEVIQSPLGSANLKGVHEVQNIGAVETYQRRYLWVAAMEIVEHDALDASTSSKKDEQQPVSAKGKVAPVTDHDGLEPDAAVLAQFNAAKDVPSLTKVMNGLPQDQRRLYNGTFQARMAELKKAA